MKSQIANFKLRTGDVGGNSSFEIRHSKFRRAFTLIEIMIVVAIIGLIAAMGIPSMLQMLHKDGMRLAVENVMKLLTDARADAILKNHTTSISFHPGENRLDSSIGESVQLPDGVAMEAIGINLMNFSETEVSTVRFFPNGTCDELTLVMHSGTDWRKITLEFATAIASVDPLKK
jgi:prepilin-type N-terminal cleavage/methylation domain-containing protein